MLYISLGNVHVCTYFYFMTLQLNVMIVYDYLRIVCISIFLITWQGPVNGGVPGLSKYLRSRFPNSCKLINSQHFMRGRADRSLGSDAVAGKSERLVFDHVCIDINQFLHMGYKHTNNITEFSVTLN